MDNNKATNPNTCHDMQDVRDLANQLLKYDSAHDGQFTLYEFQIASGEDKRVTRMWLRYLSEETGDLREEHEGTFYRGSLPL